MLEGHYQYERFNKIFNEVVETHRYEFGCLGISVEEFGTHPKRKGAATFLATGCKLFPPMASICLHTNWKLGGVKYRYIKYMKTGDQFVGSDVNGLPIFKKQSAMPPPLLFNFIMSK